MKSLLSMGVLLASALVITYTWAPKDGGDLFPVAERVPAEDFTLTDVIGTQVSLSDYEGKVVLLNFWATWCAPCRVEIPWFIEFEKQYADQGLAIVGVSFDEEGWEVVTPYAAEQDMNYRILVGDEELSQQYGVDALPTTFILDREGRVAAYHEGLVSERTYENQILGLLKEGADKTPAKTASLR